MHAALIASTSWMDDELPAYRRLVAGLIDGGGGVLQILPEQVIHDASIPVGTAVAWRDNTFAVVRRRRLSALAHRLAQENVTLIHALDAGVWRGAMALADRLQLPLVLSVNAAEDVGEAERLRPKLARLHAAVTAPTVPIRDALAQRLAAETRVELVLPGVPLPDHVTPEPSHEGLCAAIHGSTDFDANYHALFTALCEIVRQQPHSQFFLDARGGNPHGLWRAVRKFGLLTNLSMVPGRGGPGELMLHADTLLLPQALGRARTPILHAMARGVPVIARADPSLDFLIDEQTAWLIHDPTPAVWLDRLNGVLAHAPRATALTTLAGDWVRSHYGVTRYVDQLLGLYRQISGEAIRFPAAGGVAER